MLNQHVNHSKEVRVQRKLIKHESDVKTHHFLTRKATYEVFETYKKQGRPTH